MYSIYLSVGSWYSSRWVLGVNPSGWSHHPYHVLFPSVVLCESYSLLRSLSLWKRHERTLQGLLSSFRRVTPHSKRLTFAVCHSRHLLGDLLRPYQESQCYLLPNLASRWSPPKPSEALGLTDLPQQQNLLGSQSLSTV